MLDLKIVPIPDTKRAVKKFIKFSKRVYKNYPHWVAPIFSDQVKSIRKGPFNEIGEKQLFMAYRGSVSVARLSVHRNFRHNKHYNENQGFFGFFEALKDLDAVRALFDEGMKWLKDKGCSSIIGPESFAIYDEIGILMDAYHIDPVLFCSYNPPYYSEILEQIGFKKEIDWYAYFKSSYDPLPKIMQRTTERLHRRHNLKIRNMLVKNWDKETTTIRHIFEAAWSENWGNIPFSDKQWNKLMSELKLIVKEEFSFILELDGKPIAFSVSFPNASEAIKKARGNLFPFGIFKILLGMKHIYLIRTMVLGVLKKYRNRGYDLALVQKIIEESMRLGYHGSDCSLVVETNMPLIRGLETIGCMRYKTFRLYKKNLLD